MRTDFNIQPCDHSIASELQRIIDGKTKPVGALGRLEELALKIGLIQQTTAPKLNNPTMVVFAGDHGLADEGVSQFPKEVTAQMVLNFLNEGAAINVFTRQNEMNLFIVDAGVDHDFDAYNDHFLNRKVRMGSRNSLYENAVSEAEYRQCLENGREVVDEIHRKGCNIIGFGEMGIGNTSAASLIMAQTLGLSVEACVGRGTGLNDAGLSKKLEILKKVKEKHVEAIQTSSILQAFGGLEMIQMVGAMLQAAQNKMIILVDGFIASTAFLAASKMHQEVKGYAIFCHASAEQGHQLLLSHLDARPLLNLDMRLGEGTGCAIAFPIIQSAVNFLNEMASFESAGVTNEG